MPWKSIANKSLSLMVAVGYMAVIINREGFSRKTPSSVVALIFILSLIWFGDLWGGFTGYIGRGGNISNESPGWAVCVMGWFLLIGLPIVMILINKG